jgi:hypothetical protein
MGAFCVGLRARLVNHSALDSVECEPFFDPHLPFLKLRPFKT